MDKNVIKQEFTIDPAWERAARAAWLAIVDLAVWGDLQSSRLGALAKVRKRALEAGERLRSLTNSRDWIPRPREQIKNALASALHLRESLDELARAAHMLDGGAELDEFGRRLTGLRELVDQLAPLEQRWAALLDARHCDEEHE